MIDPKTFLKFLKERRSIRSFQEKQIPENEIEMILEAGRWAPSASNRQPWEFVVVKNKEILDKLSKSAIYGNFIKGVPVAIAIVAKIKTSPKWYLIDTSLVSINMMLMAWSLGIGTCWIGAMSRDKAKKIIGLGENDHLLTVLPFGYIKGEIPGLTSRKPLNKIVKHIN
ncbi:MAG: nitroreductase family protein [Candidatus Lokiarchaeota archaeon]|nr:nitroreductase family protein [Candidatus Lokiarchaeota archaeon]